MGVDILSRQVTLTGCVPSETTVNPINRSSVKRSLFGPVDHQEAMSFFHKEMSKIETEKMKQWNFDFINEKPLKGSFKWEKIPSKSPQIVSKMTFKVTKLKSVKSPRKNIKRSLVNHDNVNRRQTTITDYVNVSKKSIEARRIDSICNKNNPKVIEQTRHQ